MTLQELHAALVTGDWQKAERLLAPQARRRGAHPSLLYNYGKVLIELGRAGEASAALRRLVAAEPGHGNAWFELGRAALMGEDFAAALEAFGQALSLAPGDEDARRNLGRVALRLGAWETAAEAWSPLEGDPEADIALYRLAAETGAGDAGARRAALLQSHPDRAAVIRALVRVSKGSAPLDLRPGD